MVEQDCHPFPKVDAGKCVDCKQCEKACPIVSPVDVNNVVHMTVYGGWASDEQMRIDAASGGGFAGLAHGFFHLHRGENVAVVGARLENNRVKHIVVEKEDDIVLLMNSKYIQSDTVGIYREVKEKLKEGYWVMFSGTPCQVAALYGFLQKERGAERLVTIEVVCHGIASHEALDLHLDYYKSDKIYRFRDKRLGTQDWKYSQTTTIDREGKEFKLKRKDDVFYAIYAGWLLDRKSCSNCKYARINRVADITLADFWGLNVPEYYKQGVSLITANNDKGNALIKSADSLYTFVAPLETAINGNPHLFTGYKFIQYHPMVVWQGFFKKILPANVRLHILVNRMPYKFLWAFYKLATKWLNNYRRKKVIIALRKDLRTRVLLTKVNRGGRMAQAA